jgi:hypothetical protein
MTIAYNWVVTQTNYEVSNGFIQTAHWQCNAVDGDYTASIYSTCSWADGTPTVPYADVTMQEVLDWCWASGVDKAATEAAVQQQINNQINPPVVTPPLPWATP